MKSRAGFVSNSSSTSFVVIGKKVELENVDLSTGKKYVAVGTAIGEGCDVFEITEELLPWMKVVNYQFTVLESAEMVYDSGQITLDGGTYDVETVEKDYHGTASVEDLLDIYDFDRTAMIELVREGKMSLEDFAERVGK